MLKKRRTFLVSWDESVALENEIDIQRFPVEISCLQLLEQLALLEPFIMWNGWFKALSHSRSTAADPRTRRG